jgi:hypothetical protein
LTPTIKVSRPHRRLFPNCAIATFHENGSPSKRVLVVARCAPAWSVFRPRQPASQCPASPAVVQRLMNRAERLPPTAVVALSHHREATVSTAQLLRRGTTLSSSSTFRDHRAQGGHQLVALRQHLDRNIERSSGFLKKQVLLESTAGHRRRRPRPSPN